MWHLLHVSFIIFYVFLDPVRGLKTSVSEPGPGEQAGAQICQKETQSNNLFNQGPSP